MQKSIFTRYFSVCATLVIVSITILGAVFLIFASQYFKNDKYELLRDNTSRAAEIVEGYYDQSSPLDWTQTSSFLQLLAQTIGANVFITDPNGNTVYCTEGSNCIHTQNIIPESILESLRGNGMYNEMGKLGGIYSDRYYTVGYPLNIQGQTIGYIFTTTHASSQQTDFLGEMLKMFLISAMVVLLVTFIAVYFISIQMVKPLRQMAAAAQRFGRGEFDTRLEVTSYDEMGQLAMALNNMAQSLSTLEVSRRSFIANISHELKTPMTSIAGFIDGILDGTIPAEKQEYYLKIVSDEVKRLSRLVRTMLNLSKIEAGEMQINKARINIVDTICQTVFSFEQQIEKKNLEIRGLDHDKVMIEADPDLMHQVVYNLTENAVKFANEGGYIEFGFSSGKNGETYISIKNSGEGLSKEEMPRVFDRFYKTDKSRGLDKNGVGLGLYIVRSVVNLHGGDIIVRSARGEYVEFVFSIPSSGKGGMFKKNS